MERCFNIGVNLYDKRSEKTPLFLSVATIYQFPLSAE